MDVGIIILCPDMDAMSLRNTVKSISYHPNERECIAVVPKTINVKTIKNYKEYCQTYKGGDTITSLVNVGMKRLKHDWGFIVFAGSRVSRFVDRKWDAFVKSDKDILYPIVEKKCDFVSGSFNGVLINQSFFKEVGEFTSEPIEKPQFNDFEFSKLLWATDAIEKEASFKGIIGMKVTD